MNGVFTKYSPADDAAFYGQKIYGRDGLGLPITTPWSSPPTQREFEETPVVADYRAAMFRMWVAEEKAAYVAVMDHAANGRVAVRVADRIPVPPEQNGTELPSLQIWLEWMQYRAMPASPSPAGMAGTPAPASPFSAYAPGG